MLRTLSSRVSSLSRRALSSRIRVGAVRRFGAAAQDAGDDEYIKLTFVDLDGKMTECQAKIGESVMDCAVRNEIEMPAECNGQSGRMELFGWGPSCNSCMVYIPEKYLMKIEPMLSDEGQKLQDCFHVTTNSRLSCCVEIVPELDGAHIGLPEYPFAFEEYNLYWRPEWVRKSFGEEEEAKLREALKEDAEVSKFLSQQ